MPEPNALQNSKLPPEQISIAKRIREIREAAKLSLQELANECECTKSALLSYEHAVAPLPFQIGQRICQRLDFNQNHLAFRENPIRPFIDPSDLGADAAAEKAAEKMTFFDAWNGPLKPALEAWLTAHPLEELFEETLIKHYANYWRNMPLQSIEAAILRHASALRRCDALDDKQQAFAMLEIVIQELKRRLFKEKGVANSLIEGVSPEEAVDSPMQISERIKAVRKKCKLTQTNAAQLWNVPLKSLQNWEQGQRTPKGLALVQLKSTLDAAEESAKNLPQK